MLAHYPHIVKLNININKEWRLTYWNNIQHHYSDLRSQCHVTLSYVDPILFYILDHGEHRTLLQEIYQEKVQEPITEFI